MKLQLELFYILTLIHYKVYHNMWIIGVHWYELCNNWLFECCECNSGVKMASFAIVWIIMRIWAGKMLFYNFYKLTRRLLCCLWPMILAPVTVCIQTHTKNKKVKSLKIAIDVITWCKLVLKQSHYLWHPSGLSSNFSKFVLVAKIFGAYWPWYITLRSICPSQWQLLFPGSSDIDKYHFWVVVQKQENWK